MPTMTAPTEIRRTWQPKSPPSRNKPFLPPPAYTTEECKRFSESEEFQELLRARGQQVSPLVPNYPKLVVAEGFKEFLESTNQELRTVDQASPQDLEAEQSALGAAMLDHDALRAVCDVVGGMFYYSQHRVVHKALRAQFRAGHPVDAITTHGELKRTLGTALFPDAGMYLLALVEACSNSAAVDGYIVSIRWMAQLRSYLSLSDCIQAAIMRPMAPGEIGERVERCREAIERDGWVDVRQVFSQ